MNNIKGILLIKIFFKNDRSYALVIYQFAPWKISHRIGYKTRRIQFTANKKKLKKYVSAHLNRIRNPYLKKWMV